jgi:hypothetical protein
MTATYNSSTWARRAAASIGMFQVLVKMIWYFQAMPINKLKLCVVALTSSIILMIIITAGKRKART